MPHNNNELITSMKETLSNTPVHITYCVLKRVLYSKPILYIYLIIEEKGKAFIASAWPIRPKYQDQV